MQMLSYHPPLKEQTIGIDIQAENLSVILILETDYLLKYKSWNAENMAQAIEAVQKNVAMHNKEA